MSSKDLVEIAIRWGVVVKILVHVERFRVV
jgi:hypothetical protein